jgi:hypothetical protein
MARTAASQVSARARAVACGRTMMIAVALIVAIGLLADADHASAQPAPPPPGATQQAPYPSYSPFPSLTPGPPAQAQTPVTGPVGRSEEQRRAAEQYRIWRNALERRRQKRQLAARKQHQVEKKQKVAKRKEKRKNLAASRENQREIAESKGYKPVSDLVNFPKFFPGLGIIYVKPDTLPLGPFLCFDRDDRLVATVYMVPVKDIDDHKTLDAVGLTPLGINAPVDHVSFYFNPGHPGVDMPHYHFVIWHVSKKDEARVAQ